MSDLFSTRLPAAEAALDKMADAQNYRLRGDRKLAANWRGRAEDNVTAIRLMQAIREQDRPATPTEQTYLARFVGFGASELANGVFPLRGQPCRPGYEQVVVDLTASTSPTEWASLARATQYAHFTPEYVIRALWDAVRRFGFRGGDVLEPGCGVGLFAALMPDDMAVSSVMTGIESDPITAEIARLLHPRSDIRQADFTDTEMRLHPHALAIGNPPFSDRTVRGAGLKTTGMALHEFFVWRSVQALEPGGLAAFLVSRHLMDKANSVCRNLVARFRRLPGCDPVCPPVSWSAQAGTAVVADLVFLRRRHEGADPCGRNLALNFNLNPCAERDRDQPLLDPPPRDGAGPA